MSVRVVPAYNDVCGGVTPNITAFGATVCSVRIADVHIGIVAVAGVMTVATSFMTRVALGVEMVFVEGVLVQVVAEGLATVAE